MNLHFKIPRAGRLLIALCISTVFTLTGCSHTTEPETGSLAGFVHLINDTDNPDFDQQNDAGVKVSLYPLAELDPTLSRIRIQHPGIGIAESQETAFDYRRYSPVKSGYSNEDGSFSLKEIEVGSYNIVFSKYGWGTVVKYNIHISNTTKVLSSLVDLCEPDDNMEKTNLEVVNIYPERTVPTSVTSDFAFEQDHSYMIVSDTFFSGSCEFKGGSNLVLYPGVRLSFYGNVSFGENAQFTTLRGVYNDSLEVDRWHSMSFYADNQIIEKLIITDSMTALDINGDNCIIQNVMISNSSQGIYLPGGGTTIEKCIFSSIESRVLMYPQAPDDTEIEHWVNKSIFYQCYDVIRTLGKPVSIIDNYFIENTVAIYSFSNFHIIAFNDFEENHEAIECNGTRINIECNNFVNNTNSIIFGHSWGQVNSNPIIHNNNFMQTSGYAIKLRSQVTNDNIDARHNFWESQDIDAIVYDGMDDSQISFYVTYLPKTSTTITNAGIRD